MGRPSDGRQRLLDAACQLIRTRALSSVGVADICALADVRKGSFYYFFESKQALTLAAVDAHWTDQERAWRAILGADRPALDRLHQLVRDLVEDQRHTHAHDGMIPGCALTNLAQGLSDGDAVVQARLREIFDEEVTLVERVLHEAAADGAVPKKNARRQVAWAVLAQLEGMVLFAKAGNDPDLLAGIWAQIRLLLGADAAADTRQPSRKRATTGA